MASFVDRVVGAARLDVGTYEEVEADATATPQAMAVVVSVALASGIGALGTGGAGVAATVLGALVGWVAWASLIWFIGAVALPEKQTRADVGQLLRTIGFAASPGLLLALKLLPFVGAFVALVVWLWQLATTVVAVRQALDYKSTLHAIAVCLMGWIVYVVVSFGIALTFGIRSVELG